MKDSITPQPTASHATSVNIDVHDLFKKITTSLIGGVPIVGGALSASTGLLFDWLDGAPDPWVEFEEKINRIITNKLNQSEARFVRNSLSGLDKNLNDYLVDFNKSSGQANHAEKIQTFANRIGIISDSAERLLPHILRPTSHYATAPYLEHFFLLSVSINTIGESLKVGIYNFSKRRYELYQAIEQYIASAFNGAALERHSEIQLKNFNTSSDKRIGDAVYDHSQNKKLSGTLFGWPDRVAKETLQTIRAGAGTVSIIDLYKNALQNVHIVAQADVTSNYSADQIPKIYTRSITSHYDSFFARWNSPVMKNIIKHEVTDSSIKRIANTSKDQFLYLSGSLPSSILSKK